MSLSKLSVLVKNAVIKSFETSSIIPPAMILGACKRFLSSAFSNILPDVASETPPEASDV